MATLKASNNDSLKKALATSGDIERIELTGSFSLFPVEILRCTNLREFHAVQLFWFGDSPAIPPEIGTLENLESLEIWNSLLPTLPSDIGKLWRLRTLSLSGPILTKRRQASDGADEAVDFLPESIGELRALESLYINASVATKSALFPNAPSAAHFQLPASIGRLESLRSLSIHSNSLTELPTSLGKLALRALTLDVPAAIPEQVFAIRTLTSLRLPKCNLVRTPSLRALSDLEELALPIGALVRLAGELRHLKALKKLEIVVRDDQAEVPTQPLPREIGNLTALREIRACVAGLTGAVPESIGELAQLEILNLACNEITELPPSISRLGALVELDVANCKVKELTSRIAHLPNLKVLDFAKAPLPPNEKRLIAAMMRVAPSERAALLGKVLPAMPKPLKSTHLGAVESINNGIMLLVGDSSVASKWLGTENAKSDEELDGSDWALCFEAIRGLSNGGKPVTFAGGLLLGLALDVGGVVDAFRVANRIVLVEGAYDREGIRKDEDFLRFVAAEPSERAKKVGEIDAPSGVLAFLPAPSSGKAIATTASKLGRKKAKVVDFDSERGLVVEASGTYDVYVEPVSDKSSWGAAARAVLVLRNDCAGRAK